MTRKAGPFALVVKNYTSLKQLVVTVQPHSGGLAAFRAPMHSVVLVELFQYGLLESHRVIQVVADTVQLVDVVIFDGFNFELMLRPRCGPPQPGSRSRSPVSLDNLAVQVSAVALSNLLFSAA